MPFSTGAVVAAVIAAASPPDATFVSASVDVLLALVEHAYEPKFAATFCDTATGVGSADIAQKAITPKSRNFKHEKKVRTSN